jgi:hypothetical protein
MLFDKTTKQQVFVPAKKELSDHMKSITIEKLWPLPIKNHPFFRLEERATIR